MIKQLVVLSGKGGTGKTTVTAALAHLAAQDYHIVLADADVDAANLGLVLAPVTDETHNFTGGRIAVVDAERCIACGRCAEVCRFDAVRPGDTYAVAPIACEGCGACFYECPAGAIEMQSQRAGQWFVATTRYGPFYHAHLFAGQENSGKLVTLVKQMARLRAFDDEADVLLVDGPPGIGCPVIAALSRGGPGPRCHRTDGLWRARPGARPGASGAYQHPGGGAAQQSRSQPDADGSHCGLLRRKQHPVDRALAL